MDDYTYIDDSGRECIDVDALLEDDTVVDYQGMECNGYIIYID